MSTATALYGEPKPHRFPTHCKILATLGPASESPEMLERMIRGGATMFRLNFSHGPLEDQKVRLDAVRSVAKKMNRAVAVLGDLQGPKMRVSKVPPIDNDKGIMLETGDEVVFRAGVEEAFKIDNDDHTAVFGSTFDALYTDVDPGQRVLVNDGAIRMLVIDQKPGEELRCRVTHGGLVTSAKGVNLPESILSVPAITDKDWACVEWGVEHGVDVFALSFVRRADQIEELKERLVDMCADIGGAAGDPLRRSIPVISKIEKPQALDNLDSIVEVSDGVMVARGDLGVEMEVYHVPVAQKVIIETAAAYGKPVIVATQMLESMTQEPAPTRAEASDVANAVFDGADAVMLSGETAVGKHPDLVVETMSRIIRAAEDRIDELPHTPAPPSKLPEYPYRSAALTTGAWHIAKSVNAKLVVVWSQTGGTARYLSQNDFRVPIVAFTSSEVACRRMAFLGGVNPVHSPPPADGTLAAWTDQVEQLIRDNDWADEGDAAVLIAGKPLGGTNARDILAILRIGDISSGFRAGGDG